VELTDVLQRLGLEKDREAIEPGWAEALAGLPSGALPFLEPAFIEEGCAYSGFTPEIVAQAVRAAARIEADPALRALAWHARCRMYSGGKPINAWPLPTQALGEDAGMFYLLVLLSNWPQVRALHRAHGIPADVVADTLGYVLSRINSYRGRKGAYGLEAHGVGWVRHHLSGEIYRLGRLQFVPTKFPPVCAAYRHRRNGLVAALAAEGIEFRADGQKNGAGGVTEREGVWKSALVVRADVVVGNPIDPVAGKALREVVALPTAEWEESLKPGDPILETHIPGTDPLTPERCAESIHRAAEFFPRHFPENPAPRAFICGSWLMDPQLEPYLRPDSNIVNFLRQFYLYPVDCDGWSGLRTAFKIDLPHDATYAALDLAHLPQDNSLRRGMVAHIRAGGRWRAGGGFILIADLPWGRQPYRRAARPWSP